MHLAKGENEAFDRRNRTAKKRLGTRGIEKIDIDGQIALPTVAMLQAFQEKLKDKNRLWGCIRWRLIVASPFYRAEKRECEIKAFIHSHFSHIMRGRECCSVVVVVVVKKMKDEKIQESTTQTQS
ncbi:hypothetical protein VNO77_16463 [Canavalia gladiata]|uniref:Uncharacterized protein n=1 Tax=Canavalia gladiata TaxID=3824 RepID=A0AAN9M1S6_CANGL